MTVSTLPDRATEPHVWRRRFGLDTQKPLSQRHAEELRIEQVLLLSRRTPTIALINVANCLLTIGFFWKLGPRGLLVGWLLLILGFSARRLQAWQRHRRLPRPKHMAPGVVKRAVRISITAGFLWGGVSALVFPSASVPHQLLLCFVAGGMAAGGLASLSCVPAAANGYILMCLAPLILRLGIAGDPIHWFMAAFSSLYCFALIAFVRSSHSTFIEGVQLRLSNIEQSETLAKERTELDRAKAEATNARNLVIDAIEAMADTVTLYDSDERLVLFNHRADKAHMGGSKLFCLGRTYGEILRESVRTNETLSRSIEGPDFIQSEEARHKRGDGLPCELHVAEETWIIDRAFRTRDGGTLHIGTNISALKKATTEAESSSRAKSEFLANMSHELRTPLNAIIGFSEMIRDALIGPLDARYRDYAGDVNKAGLHLQNIINDILDISKIEDRRLELRDDIVSIAESADACARLVASMAESAQVSVTVEIPDTLPLLRADELRLKQILLNLLSNAVKFTPPGGHVSVSATGEDDGAVISVKDNGIGMKPEDIEIALQPFRQIDGSLARRFEGTGLGLPLAKALVELHGGRLEIESAPTAGTTVRILLPKERVLGSDTFVRSSTPEIV